MPGQPATAGRAARSAPAKPVFATGFESDLAAAGWKPLAGTSAPPPGAWSRQEPYGGERCLAILHAGEAKDEGWESPRFPVKALQHYKLTFFSRGSGPALWAVFFYDSEGKLLEGDVYDGIDPSSEWAESSFCFATKYPGVQASVAVRLCGAGELHVDDVSVTPAGRREVGEWADRVYRGMPWPTYVPPADALRYLPRTMQKLRHGGPFRIVLLGDSIANDLSNSPLDVLMERAFPKAQIEVRFTGRGGTGWATYQDQVQQRVVAHQPDLLILLAISNRAENLVPPLQRILAQTREACPETEFLLITPHIDFRNETESGRVHRERILAFAREQHIEVIDLFGEWERYLALAGRPQAWLMRDPVHMNVRGRQLSARIVARHFGLVRPW